MRALDTNVLVYAFDGASEHHAVARRVVRDLAEGDLPWALPWPCVYEFLRIVTHPAVTRFALPVSRAWDNLNFLFESPSVVVLGETERHRSILSGLLRGTRVVGNLVHDAHIAALLLEHGVREIITNDDDFRRFEELKVINPFRV